MTDETYTYRWTSDWPAVINGHTTPKGTGVDAFPGKNFSTIAPVDSPFAQPANAAAKKAAKEAKADEPEDDDKTPPEDDPAGGDSTADDQTPDGTDGAGESEGAS